MAYKITDEQVMYVNPDGTLVRKINAICDTASDLVALGTDWYPMSTAIISDPFVIKILSPSKEWKSKE